MFFKTLIYINKSASFRTDMTVPPLLPKGEAIRRAVAWLAHQGPWTPELIEEASQRFDLSPTEEEFLLQESRRFRNPETHQKKGL